MIFKSIFLHVKQVLMCIKQKKKIVEVWVQDWTVRYD